MKKRRTLQRYAAAACLLLGGLLAAIGCSENYEYGTDYSVYNNVTITVDHLDGSGALDLKVDNQYNLTLTVTPENMSLDNTACHFVLDDPTLADISAEGSIMPKLAGQTKLTVTFRGNEKVTTSCILRITRDPVPVTGIKIPSALDVEINTEYNFADNVTVLPGNADNPAVTYENDNPNALTITPEGVIKAGSVFGRANITVASVEDPNIKATCLVRVLDKIPVTGMKLPTKMEGKSFPIFQKIGFGSAITLTPTNATDKSLNYEIVEGQGVVSVSSDGVITPIATGDVKIKVTANGIIEGDPEVSGELSFTIVDNETFYQRVLWTAHSNILYSTGNDYTVDSNNGPMNLILDEAASTYAVLTKPGKTYNDAKTPEDYKLAITVDMGAPNTFNYFNWAHRSSNTTEGLRVWGITLQGSDDDVNYTNIGDFDIPHSDNKAYDINLPSEVTYRYVKILLTKWSDNSGGGSTGSTMQIGGFNVGKK
ncbi:MAG: Ig-like domain-containing protein [Mediterranea sp.]|jgi:hypothetical protein|nr:Ig-like domain-containing protein [Mediterranea sp.]